MSDGKIDPLEGLASDKVYLFSGGADQIVGLPSFKRQRTFTSELGWPMTKSNLIRARMLAMLS